MGDGLDLTDDCGRRLQEGVVVQVFAGTRASPRILCLPPVSPCFRPLSLLILPATVPAVQRSPLQPRHVHPLTLFMVSPKLALHRGEKTPPSRAHTFEGNFLPLPPGGKLSP